MYGFVRFCTVCTVCTVLSESLQVFQALVNRSLFTVQLFSLSLLFFDNSLRCFSQEAGANWIKESDKRSDYDKEGGFAALRYAHHLLYTPKWNEGIEAFHNAEVLPDLDDWEKYLIKADVGFSTKLIYDFDLLAKIEWEFNSMPANDRKKSDVRYIVGLGYKW